MSIRFTINSTESKAIKEGDSFIRFSGVSEPFRRVSERAANKVGVDGAGQPKLVFTTGLDDKQVDFYKWYTEDEKKVVKKQIKELAESVTKYYVRSIN